MRRPRFTPRQMPGGASGSVSDGAAVLVDRSAIPVADVATGTASDVPGNRVPHLPDQADPPRVSTGFVWLLVLAAAGTWLAYTAPLSYSMAIRIHQLAPGHDEYLGYLTGLGGVFCLLAGPFFGVRSDRSRSRLGRRRPFLIGGAVLGVAGLAVMGLAPDIPVLGIGWVLVAVGWTTVMNAITYLMADRIPPQQRGRVSGFVGFAQLTGPVLGIGVATTLEGDNLLMLLAPGLVGSAVLIPLIAGTGERDTRSARLSDRLSIGLLFGKFVFDPRRYPDFSWNLLGRFLFYVGLSFNSTFTTLFLAQRLGESVNRVGHLVAALSGGAVLATTTGAIGGGYFSDRFQRRRVFVMLAGAVFCAGSVTMALSAAMPTLLCGYALAALGIGGFSAVDQAIMLDVLPDRSEAGRFIGIVNYAQQIPHALAPLAASVLLGIGATSTHKDYTALYLAAGSATLAGALVIMLRVEGSP